MQNSGKDDVNVSLTLEPRHFLIWILRIQFLQFYNFTHSALLCAQLKVSKIYHFEWQGAGMWLEKDFDSIVHVPVWPETQLEGGGGRWGVISPPPLPDFGKSKKRYSYIHISLPGFKISTWSLASEKWVINIRDTKHVLYSIE